MGFVAHLYFDNTKDTAVLEKDMAPLTIDHHQHLRAWLTNDRFLTLGSGNLAVVTAEPGGMLPNEDSVLSVSTPRGTPIAPHAGGIGYPCPEETDLDLKIAGRCVARVRRGCAGLRG